MFHNNMLIWIGTLSREYFIFLLVVFYRVTLTRLAVIVGVIELVHCSMMF